jgi:hypothetical protein
VPALIKYKEYKEGHVCTPVSEWGHGSGTGVEDGEHAVRLSGQGLAGVQVQVL